MVDQAQKAKKKLHNFCRLNVKRSSIIPHCCTGNDLPVFLLALKTVKMFCWTVFVS